MLGKIIFLGLAVCIMNIFLKKQQSEFILPMELVYLTVAVALSLEYLQKIFSDLSGFIDTTEYGSEILSSAIKGAGVCILTKFSSDICAENGNKLIADVIEFTGRVMLLIIAAPYVESVIRIAMAFAE